ncbi:MAG: hypothetical protein LBS61_01870 [Endomicrobium sp.]|jgi:hypothetical protein|nr:hypothetical protein [Endomicrobium sp.]
MAALYESSNAIFSSLGLENLFPMTTFLLKDATNSKDVSVFVARIARAINNSNEAL